MLASVLSNGDIFGCPNIPRRKELIQGNVLKDDFCEVWKINLNFTEILIEQKLSNVKNVSIGITAKVIVFIPLTLKPIHHSFVTKSFYRKGGIGRNC